MKSQEDMIFFKVLGHNGFPDFLPLRVLQILAREGGYFTGMVYNKKEDKKIAKKVKQFDYRTKRLYSK